ncbi:NADAR family protein [Undibacterium sp. Ji83W]|uniref:NADAR family protein n=1 Tax=Undibacterium sp. Ji83W TaxID=3413043 RepID=UPI003BF3A5F0
MHDGRFPPPFFKASLLILNDSNSDTTIKFYSAEDEYGEFSNFARYSISMKGKTWPTSEHYFQAQKFVDAIYREKIRKANTPAIAARLGRARTEKLRPDWESVKVQVMRDAVTAKFQQHEDLRAMLLSTGSAKLIEDTTDDSYWGCGSDGRGKNMLGRILMEVRATLAQ